MLEAESTIGGGSRSAELTLPGFVHDVCCRAPAGARLPGAARPAARGPWPALAAARGAAGPPPGAGGAAGAVGRGHRRRLRRGRRPGVAPHDGAAGGVRDPAGRRAPVAAHRPAPGARRPGPLRARRHPLGVGAGPQPLRARRGPGPVRRPGRPLHALARGPDHRRLRADAGPARPPGRLALAEGGSQRIVDALVSVLAALGGTVETGRRVETLDELDPGAVVLFDLTPRQVVAIAGDRLPDRYRRRLERYRYGRACSRSTGRSTAPSPGPRRTAPDRPRSTWAAPSRRWPGPRPTSPPVAIPSGRTCCWPRPAGRPDPGPGWGPDGLGLTATSRTARPST